MLLKKKICCIITARKNSKGLPNKNLKKINGKPLIYYPIKAALKSKYIDKVFFNSDSIEMIKKAKSFGATVNFIRPKSLSNSNTKSADVLINHINRENLDKEYHYILLLEPTSPLTNSKDIDKSIVKLIKNRNIGDSLLSVSDGTVPNSYLKFKAKNNFLYPVEKKKYYTTRRQDFPKNYFIDGSLYLSKIKTLKKFKSFVQKRTMFILMDKYKMFQIDDVIDFKIVEMLMKKFKK